MSLKIKHTAFEPKGPVKMHRATYSFDSTAFGSFLTNDTTHSKMPSLTSLSSPQDRGDIECTNRELEAIEHTAQVLMRERAQKQNYERDLIRIKNSMQKIMESNFPLPMKIKLMESTNALLETKLTCIKDNNKNIQEIILRLEGITSYKTSLRVLSNWCNSGTLSTYLTDNVLTTLNETLNNGVLTRDSIMNRVIDVELQNGKEAVERMKAEIQKLEEIVILLKQVTIPLTISIENLKEDFDDLQQVVKERRETLEAKLMIVEGLKKRLSRTDIRETDKENVNPQLAKKRNIKLHDIYINFEEKSQDLNNSRINMSATISNNKTVLQGASAKISKVFGTIFRGKKQRAPSHIFTTEVLRDLGIDNTIKR